MSLALIEQIKTLPWKMEANFIIKNDFIQKYIFPGGMLICPTKINELSLAADLEVTNDYMMGESYAKTLDLWRESFLENWKKISDYLLQHQALQTLLEFLKQLYIGTLLVKQKCLKL